MKIEINNNKCYFEGFQNKIDGVSFRNCPTLLDNKMFKRITEAVFQSLGMIKFSLHDSQKVIFIQKHILTDWINEHKQFASDSPIYQNNFVCGFRTNQMTVDEKLQNGQLEEAINIICKDHQEFKK